MSTYFYYYVRLLSSEALPLHFRVIEQNNIKKSFSTAHNEICCAQSREGENGIGASKHTLKTQKIESIEIGTPNHTLTTQKVHYDVVMTQTVQHDQFKEFNAQQKEDTTKERS